MRRVTAVFLGAAIGIATLAEPAAAQLTAPFPDVPTVGSTFPDTGYDPKHDAYLVVGSVGATGSTTLGRFIDAAAHSALAQFLVLSANSATCSTAYSPDLSDGVGGVGAFLVACYTSAGIITEVVAYPGRVVGSPVTAIPPIIPLLSLGERVAMAYSSVDRVFLIAWPDNATKAVRVDLTGQPVGSIMSLSTSAGGPCNDSNLWTCYDIHVVWNPKTAEFGVLEIDGVNTPFLSLVRVAGNGAVLGHSDLIGLGPGTKAIDVNPTTGSYVAAWSAAGGPGVMNRAEIDGTGAILSTGMINGIASSDFLSALVYSPISRSFLLVGHSAPLGGDQAFVELDGHGVPKALPIVSAAYGQFPRATARTTAPEWFINYPSLNGTGRFVRTGSCATPDPFAALGGGTCVNGGWYPPTTPSPSPSPTPTPSPGGCTTPDPFTALGGGTCVNGGWYPPTTPAPTPTPTPTPAPTPTPSPGGCTTPDPFTALGGGTCANGGWYPPSAAPPPPVPGGCTTPDPFVFFGGGVCINGGWHPR
jgi:hypothetical protein